MSLATALPNLAIAEADEFGPEITSVRMSQAKERRPTLRPTSRGKIVGNDPRIREVLDIIDRVAPTNCTVLVTGESGTGKELFVAALHDASPRREAPLVALNCGAIPDNLVESELFGHAKGAFTGAATARRGLVAAAEGGTLFLDEVGELPMACQVKLLRLLQAREYTPVGETRPIRCNVRIVAATNRDLEREVLEGRFREDLYFRLNVIHVELPSLRDRPDDIPVLADYFLKSCAERAGREDILGFTQEALEVLARDPWVGNVRALENTVERAVLLAPGPYVGVRDLPPRFRERERPSAAPSVELELPEEGTDLAAAVEEFENRLIRQALQRTGGNKNRAAQLLRLNRTTLVEMIKRKKLAVSG
jgi:sigma-54 specific flagellar transcriptional regulator A